MGEILELNAKSERLVVLTMRGTTIEGCRIPWLSDDPESKKEVAKMFRKFADWIELDALLQERPVGRRTPCLYEMRQPYTPAPSTKKESGDE